MLEFWSEMDLIVADEFRGGNVPAIMKPVTVARRAFGALPSTVEQFYFRGDLACQGNELIDWPEERTTGGRLARIHRVCDQRAHEPGVARGDLLDSEKKSWERLNHPDATAIRECAEVVFVSNHEAENKQSKPLRYVAIRMRARQGELFGDGSSVKHFAIVFIAAAHCCRRACEQMLEEMLLRMIEAEQGAKGEFTVLQVPQGPRFVDPQSYTKRRVLKNHRSRLDATRGRLPLTQARSISAAQSLIDGFLLDFAFDSG